MRVIVRWIGLFAFYLCAAVVMTYPLALNLDSRLVGHAFSDSTEYVRHSWWMAEALRGRIALDAPLLLYPDGIDSALLWSIPLQSLPTALLSFILPLPAAFNLATLLTLALNGVAMHALLRTLDVRGSGALIAGLVFMLFPAFQGQLALGHVGLLALYPLPPLLIALMRLRRGGAVWWGAAAAALTALTGAGSFLLLIYAAAPIIGAWLARLVWRREWRALARTGIALAVGAGIAGGAAVLALRTATAREADSLLFSASPLHIVSPSYSHPVWGALDYPRRVLGVDPFEGAAYIGIIAGALALIGLIRRRESRFWLTPAAGAWVLSWGALLQTGHNLPLLIEIAGHPTYIALPWALLERLPILEVSRTPIRFHFAVGFALAVMAGYGANVLMNRPHPHALRASPPSVRKATLHLERGSGGEVRRHSAVVFLVLAALIAFDYQTFFPMPTSQAAIPVGFYDLGARTDIRAVFNVPWVHPLTDKEGLYLQTAHGKPMIAGHIARRTLIDPAKAWILEMTLDPALLDAAGADAIILHRDWDDAEGVLEARLIAAFGAPTFADDRFAVFEPPDPTGAPGLLGYAPAPSDTEALLYLYAPDDGDYRLNGQIAGETGRTLALTVDDAEVLRWQIGAPAALDIPLTLTAGYHTIRIAADPPCPLRTSAALRCISLQLEGLTLR
jgi:hypothetical protein